MSRHLTDHDRRIWARVARTVRPAAGQVIPELEAAVDHHDAPPAQSRSPAWRAQASTKAQPASPSQPGPLADVSNQRQVRRGRLDVDARLDLHGHTQDTAHRELVGFITFQQAMGARCVLVITGKGRLGGGVLRARFLDWIGDPGLRPMIAGYSRAHVRHGGEGAFYVLLKVRKTPAGLPSR